MEKDAPDRIQFYKPKDAYGYFSNFYPSQIEIKGQKYKTVEHYFQSQKFIGMPEEALVINSQTPGEAFKLAKKHKPKRLANWNEIKDDVMYTGLQAKFTVHKDLQEKLLATGHSQLIEHTKNDDYWADAGDGSGKNRLGELLMKLRSELRLKP